MIVTPNENSEKYYLYFGRLSEEKGVITLLKAFQTIDAKLLIAGTGPIEEFAKNFIISNKMDNVTLLGFVSGKDLKEIVGNAKAVILPSEWYENGPYSAIEALQMCRPIIGSNIGGIPELISQNGYLFETGNPIDLREKIKRMDRLTNTEYELLKNNSYKIFLKNYTKENHYKQLEKLYREICLKN